jgi:hypothetical protein
MQDINIKPVEKKKPQVVAKVSKISAILEVSDKAKKSSLKLRRTFEKGIYQKRTQLSVLKRYKRRLDLIELEDDRRTRLKSRKKIQLPNIKKFAGNFFSPGAADDPFKAIGALAAFNAATKASSGDWLGAFGPALVAGGALLGPGLLGAGANRLFNKGGKVPKGFDKFGRRVSKPVQQRYAQRYGDKAFKNRFGARNLKNISPSNGASKLAGKGIQKALGKFGRAIIPGAGAYFSAQDAKEREKEGDIFGSRVSGLSATLAGTAAGLQLAAGGAAATGIGLPAAGVIELIAGSAEVLSFGLDAFNLLRDVTGQSDPKNQLKKQTEKQKELVLKKKDDKNKLTFKKTLNSYERVIDKFDKFSKSFSGSFNSYTKDESTTMARRVEDQLGNQPTGGGIPGEGFRGQVAQYLTGDTSDSGYDKFHDSTYINGRFNDNYHDHFAFKDRATAVRAYKFLKGKNIQVTELKGYDVVGGHGDGSAHYSGLAFDVPGAQWGGTPGTPSGPKERAGSARVRALMNEFFGASNSSGARNMFNMEIHATAANEKQKSGLMPSYLDPSSKVSKEFASVFGQYPRSWRVDSKTGKGLGMLERGGNILETDMKKGVDKNAQDIFNVIKNNPNTTFNIFAGHNDVTKGELGAPGEQNYNRLVAEKLEEMSRSSKLKNFTYHRSIIANNDNDPNANWNRVKALRERNTQIIQPQPQQRNIASYTQYAPSTRQQQVIPLPMPLLQQPNQPVMMQQSSSAPSLMQGPSEEQVLNSFYKRVLLNTLQ